MLTHIHNIVQRKNEKERKKWRGREKDKEKEGERKRTSERRKHTRKQRRYCREVCVAIEKCKQKWNNNHKDTEVLQRAPTIKSAPTKKWKNNKNEQIY